MSKGKIIGACMALALCSCWTDEQSFSQYEFCLGGSVDINMLKAILRQTAIEQNMTFSDISEQTQRELELAHNVADLRKSYPITQMSIYKRGLGLSVGNAGFAPNHMMIGFSGRKGTADIAHLEHLVVARLSQQWRIVRSPMDNNGQAVLHCEGEGG